MATKTFKIGLSNTDKQNMAQDVYERLLALTFPEYDSAESYEVGDFVVYNDQLYKCIGSTSGAWDSTKWQLATLNDLLTDIESAVAFVNDKANVDGNYPTLTAGLADNLTPYSEDSGAEQDNPFISNGTGTNNNTEIVTVGDYALFKEKQGHTVCVNQLVQNGNFASTSGWGTYLSSISVANNKCTFLATGQYGFTRHSIPDLISGHKYLLKVDITLTTATSSILFGLMSVNNIVSGSFTRTSSGSLKQTLYKVFDCSANVSNSTIFIEDERASDWDNVVIENVCEIDLTQMFNGDIPQDLLDNPSHFSWYYNGSLAYNEGSLVNANGVKLVSTGRNLFDGTHDFFVAPNKPYYCYGTATITYKDKDGNTISSESVTNTTFTTPSNCVIVGASGSGQITITPYYTPEEGGEGYDKYYPYEEPYVVDTGNEVLRQAGSIKDYKTPDGTITRNVGSYTFTGEESWIASGQGYDCTIIANLIKKPTANNAITNISIANFYRATADQVYLGSYDKIISVNTGGYINVRDTANITSSDTARSYMAGKTIYYELATPTTEQGTPFAENLPINDYGMLYWLDSSNNLVGIPQGAKIFYPVNYKGFLDDLYSKVEGNSDDYALNSELNAKFETYLKSLSGYDATATQVLKNVEGMLTWVTEE